MGVQIGTKYTLTGPDGTVATFNDSTDANFCGFLSDIAGLDSPDVRSSGEDFTERDGGINGNSYFGRRPVALSGFIPPSTALTRNAQIEKFQRAATAMRADAVLTWTEADAIQRRLLLRRQTPMRIAGMVEKTFNVGFVSAIYAIESAVPVVTSDAAAPLSIAVTNSGNEVAYPTVQITNTSGVALTVPTTITFGGVTVFRLAYALPTGRSFTADFRARTVVDDLAVNLYRYVDFTVTTWAGLNPGAVTVACDKGTRMDVTHRHSWA